VVVDVAVRRDAEFKAGAGMTTLPVAIISHGNSVKSTEYSFLANVLAARGYLVASIQHDLPNDAPLMTKEGSLYVGRLGVYERGEQNILYAIRELQKVDSNADYDHLTLVGHSNGGDISMFFAQQHPDLVQRVVTLDNLRVPILKSGPKILSFRSKDTVFKADPGVVPDDKDAKKAGIDIIRTDAQHTDMSDRGPDSVKTKIQDTLDHFLSEDSSSNLRPANTNKLIVSDPRAMGP
jgi:pimeloyl-ACP methyl ester carboxylesterase